MLVHHDRLEDSDDEDEDDGWGPGSDDEESTKKKKKPVRYGPPDEEAAAKALRKALSHLEDSDGNNIALWYKWLAGRQLSDLEEDEEDGPIFTKAKAALAKLVKNVGTPPCVAASQGFSLILHLTPRLRGDTPSPRHRLDA